MATQPVHPRVEAVFGARRLAEKEAASISRGIEKGRFPAKMTPAEKYAIAVCGLDDEALYRETLSNLLDLSDEASRNSRGEVGIVTSMRLRGVPQGSFYIKGEAVDGSGDASRYFSGHIVHLAKLDGLPQYHVRESGSERQGVLFPTTSFSVLRAESGGHMAFKGTIKLDDRADLLEDPKSHDGELFLGYEMLPHLLGSKGHKKVVKDLKAQRPEGTRKESIELTGADSAILWGRKLREFKDFFMSDDDWNRVGFPRTRRARR